jgi:hypothetical protein
MSTQPRDYLTRNYLTRDDLTGLPTEVLVHILSYFSISVFLELNHIHPIILDVFKSNAAQISSLAIENEPELKSRADSWEGKLPRSISGLSRRESPSSRMPHLRQPSPGPKNSYQEERLEETGCSEGTRGGRDPYKV